MRDGDIAAIVDWSGFVVRQWERSNMTPDRVRIGQKECHSLDNMLDQRRIATPLQSNPVSLGRRRMMDDDDAVPRHYCITVITSGHGLVR